MTTPRAVAYTNLTADDYVIADPVEAARAGVSDPPYWAVIHPSGSVSLIHGRPTELELRRAVEGNIDPLVHGAEWDLIALAADDTTGRRPNGAAREFLGVGYPVLGPVVLIGAYGPDGERTPLPADARMRLVREVIEA